MASSNAFVQAIVSGEADMISSRYTLNAALTIIVYDWLLTISHEVKLVWPARWSIVKVIYLLNRYFVPLNVIFAIYGWSGKALWFKPLSCKIWITTDTMILLAFFAGLHFLVALRAWALWERSKTMGIVIWGTFAVYLGLTVAINIKAMLSIPAILTPFLNICFGNLPSYLWLIWLPSIIFESFIFGLTAVKAYQHSRHHVDTPILSVLYRDGFLYFLFISLNSVGNLAFWAMAAPTKVILMKYLCAALSQAAGTHLVLDLLSVGHKTGQTVLSEQKLSKGNVGESQNGNYELRKLPITPRRLEFLEMDSKGSVTPPGLRDDSPLKSWNSPEEWNYSPDEQQPALRYDYRTIYQTPSPTSPRGIQWSDETRGRHHHPYQTIKPPASNAI